MATLNSIEKFFKDIITESEIYGGNQNQQKPL